jgi:hypothetical protein
MGNALTVYHAGLGRLGGKEATMERLIVVGPGAAYFARRVEGWSFLPAGPRGVELPIGVSVLTDADVSRTLGTAARIVGDAVRLVGMEAA